MIVAVDASSLVAIALREQGWERHAHLLAEASEAWSTQVNLLEASLILVVREGLFTPPRFGAWLAEIGVQSTHMIGYAEALDAYLRYGKGIHRAGLNLGDCFAYALAKTLDAPLLFKGDDFVMTDVTPAL